MRTVLNKKPSCLLKVAWLFYYVRSDFTAGYGPSSVAIGDLDGNGSLDLAVANRYNDNVWVLIKVIPAITVIYPNGGDYLFAGDTFEISRTYSDCEPNCDIESVKIEYSINNGTDWIEIIDIAEISRLYKDDLITSSIRRYSHEETSPQSANIKPPGG